MTTFEIYRTAWVPSPLPDVFEFFSDPVNLNALTPARLHFKIVSPVPISMQIGCVIDYRLRLGGIPVRWRSEITAWDPPCRFVDEQRRGPYHLWVHEHRFEEMDGGTTIVDHVSYVPRGGTFLHRHFVRPNLATIFGYRQAQLRKRFGEPHTEGFGSTANNNIGLVVGEEVAPCEFL